MVELLKNNISDEAVQLDKAVVDTDLILAIRELARKRKIPVDVKKDEFYISDGSLLSGIFSKNVPCVSLTHPKMSSKYFTILVELRTDYGKHHAFVHLGGTSRNLRDINMAKLHAQKHGSGFFSSMLAGNAEANLRDEQMYYDALYDLIAAGLAEAQYPTPKPKRDPKATAAAEDAPKTAPKKAAAPKAAEKPVAKTAEKPATKAAEKPAARKAAAPKNTTKVHYGLETVGGVFTPIIRKGEALPATGSIAFSTAADDQTAVEIHAMCGNSYEAAECRSLGKYMLSGIAPAPRGVPRIEITFTVDGAGHLDITAVDTGSDKALNVTVEENRPSAPPKTPQPKEAPKTQLGTLSCSHQEPELPEYILSADNDTTFMTDAGLCLKVLEKETCYPTRKTVPLSLKAGQTVRVLDGIRPVCDFAVVGLLDTLQAVVFLLEVGTKGQLTISATLQESGEPLSVHVVSAPRKTQKKPEAPVEKKAEKKPEAPAPQPVEEEPIDRQLRRIRELHELLQKGALTQEEFALLKKSILS